MRNEQIKISSSFAFAQVLLTISFDINFDTFCSLLISKYIERYDRQARVVSFI